LTENFEDSDRITDEAAETVVVVVVVVSDEGMDGIHPPMIKPPLETKVTLVPLGIF